MAKLPAEIESDQVQVRLNFGSTEVKASASMANGMPIESSLDFYSYAGSKRRGQVGGCLHISVWSRYSLSTGCDHCGYLLRDGLHRIHGRIYRCSQRTAAADWEQCHQAVIRQG